MSTKRKSATTDSVVVSSSSPPPPPPAKKQKTSSPPTLSDLVFRSLIAHGSASLYEELYELPLPPNQIEILQTLLPMKRQFMEHRKALCGATTGYGHWGTPRWLFTGIYEIKSATEYGYQDRIKIHTGTFVLRQFRLFTLEIKDGALVRCDFIPRDGTGTRWVITMFHDMAPCTKCATPKKPDPTIQEGSQPPVSIRMLHRFSILIGWCYEEQVALESGRFFHSMYRGVRDMLDKTSTYVGDPTQRTILWRASTAFKTLDPRTKIVQK